MQESAKYLIHADITASGVVERSDVVGAIFGQTEGLLGDDLDLRDLQESDKLGRIDVEIHSEGGASFGEIHIASGLDKVETAILAAALESIERVGPCRSTIEISDLEDVRTAKRRQVVDRATELLDAFDDTTLTSEELIAEVRQRVRTDEITEYEGLPAGPRVADSDAIIVVEGRSDVLTLLKFGIKNAIAVEGTDVPDSVADLTRQRTVTAFLDGDRGGTLILKELAQVGAVDYVAFAPQGQSVENLSRDRVMAALRQKVPYERVAQESDPVSSIAATDGSARPAPPDATGELSTQSTESDDQNAGLADNEPDNADSGQPAVESSGQGATPSSEGKSGVSSVEPSEKSTAEPPEQPQTVAGHVAAVIESESGLARLLDGEQSVLAETPADEAFDAIEAAETVPTTVVLDGVLSQRVLDVAAQRGVGQIVAREEGEFVKQPTDVHIRTAAAF